MGHGIDVPGPPSQDVHQYFDEGDVAQLADLLIAAADIDTSTEQQARNEAGYAFIAAMTDLMICPTCGSLLMPSEDPPRHYVPEALTDEEIDAEWRKPPPGWDE